MKINFLLSVILVFVFGGRSFACESATCPLLPEMDKSALKIALEYEQIDQVETLNRRGLINAQWSPFSNYFVRMELPYVFREHTHTHHGEVETWKISGPGDVWLILDNASIENIGIHGGIKLPTGKTDAKNSEGEEAEVAIQPGSGSTDYFFGASFDTDLFRSGIGYQISGVGKKGWKNGNVAVASIGKEFRVDSSLRLGVTAFYKNEATPDAGATGESTSNFGGSWIYVSPSVTYQAFSALVQWPVSGSTLAWNLRTGVSLEL